MQKAAVACLYGSAIILVFGTLDRFVGPGSFIPGVAPGAYWKGGLMLLAYAAVLRLWPMAERST
jgi:hypothetical protein